MFVRQALLAAVAASAAAAALPVFRGEYAATPEGHRAFGRGMGTAFSAEVQARLAVDTRLQDGVLPWLRTAAGTAVYDRFFKAHEAKYPAYMAELRGVAEGAAVPFSTIFAMNLIQEFMLASAPSKAAVDHCSDYTLHLPAASCLLHNEDSVLGDAGNTMWVDVRIGGRRLTSYVYAGDLPTGAFGFVDGEFAFTLNKVPPAKLNADVSSYGRGFVSRDLLAMSSFEAAVAMLRGTPMLGGHNYQILNARSGAMVNVEVYGGDVVVTPIPAGAAVFHANEYEHIPASARHPQLPDAGSAARSARAAELPRPRTVRAALAVLADQGNASYPVFHNASRSDVSGLTTLCTVHFDWATRVMRIITGNPVAERTVYSDSFA
eukprot:TRINITY_DN27494_c0_g1_i1.p1 TRINITY_DN27494_c0_g1~~TRINITY_DN27494_c0_g1_i1.p1  ORF type:complete len:377 (+),score=99.85 TRINITY_DN27494_c0_g1_i1:49-1179(+)